MINEWGLAGLGVQVDDVEPTPGTVRFYARAEEQIPCQRPDRFAPRINHFTRGADRSALHR